jgi:hypothetical protein
MPDLFTALSLDEQGPNSAFEFDIDNRIGQTIGQNPVGVFVRPSVGAIAAVALFDDSASAMRLMDVTQAGKLSFFYNSRSFNASLAPPGARSSALWGRVNKPAAGVGSAGASPDSVPVYPQMATLPASFQKLSLGDSENYSVLAGVLTESIRGLMGQPGVWLRSLTMTPSHTSLDGTTLDVIFLQYDAGVMFRHMVETEAIRVTWKGVVYTLKTAM